MTHDVQLIRPAYGSVYGYYGENKPGPRQINPPLGLLCIASALREISGYSVRLFDGEVDEPGGLEEPARITGITATTAEIDNARALAQTVRGLRPDTVIVVGGPHASALPEATLAQYPEFDIAVSGEGELAMCRIADAVLRGRGSLADIPNIAFRDDAGRIVTTEPGPPIPDLDALPMAAWDMLDLEQYFYPMGQEGMRRFAMVQTMRGCPNKCIFCYQQFGPAVRYRSPENVAREIRYLREEKGIEFLNFIDDTFALNFKRLEVLLETLRNHGLDLRYKCMTRANTVTPELAGLLASTGCVRVSMGVESGSQRILDNARKGTRLEQYVEGFRLMSAQGIETRGSFILGLPGETLETMAETIAFSKRLDLFHAAFNIATPYPGTELWARAKAGDGYRFLAEKPSWSAFRRWGDVVAAPPGFGREEMLAMQAYAHAEFFAQDVIVEYYEGLERTLRDSDYALRPFRDARARRAELQRDMPPLYARLLDAVERAEAAGSA